MNYAALASGADKLLKTYGAKATVRRAGANITSGWGVLSQAETRNETARPSSVLASTAIATKTLLLSGLAKPVLVGDVVTFDATNYTVSAVETIRPATTTVLYKLEVH